MIDGETLTYIRKEIERQLNVVLLANSSNASTDGQTEEVLGLFPGAPSIGQRPKMQPYGLTSMAPANTPSIVALQGAGKSNRIVLGHRDQNRPSLGQAGEVMLYDNFGNQVHLQQGKIVLKADEIDLTENPTDAVALANLVKTELTKIAASFTTLTSPSGPVTGATYVTPGNVASTKVKAS